MLCAFAVACGASAFAGGFYDLAAWGPLALVLLCLVLVLAIARPAMPIGPAALALAALGFLWLWALLSTGWAESADRALTESNRWLLLGAMLAFLLLLLREPRLRVLLVACATVAIGGVALFITGALLLGDGGSLFLGGRLNDPLGYINGEAGFLLLGFWPAIAAAERARSPFLAGAALAAAVLLAGLLLLTQTRAVVPGLLVSTAVLVALVPGRARRLWALVLVAAAVGLAAGPLLDVYQQASGARLLVDDGTARRAALALLLAALGSGTAWAAVSALAARVAEGPPALAARLATVSALALALLALAGAGLGAAHAGSIADRVSRGYGDFTELRTEQPNRTRLLSGSGNRYDYWRIAWGQFRDQPLRGLGAGNYYRTYFRERRTTENVRQPHSIELQAMAELGLVGVAALALFVLAVLAGLWRAARARGSERGERALAIAGGGMFLTWLVHTSVDWLHNIPGVTGLALCGAAVLLAPWMRPRSEAAGRWRWAAVAAVALVVGFGAVQVGRQTLADRYRAAGREALASDPRAALRDANRSLSLNGEAPEAHYLKAAALARFNLYARSRSSLLDAARLEPSNFVPWALLGDLAVRRGDLREAGRFYGRALRLNPREPALRSLARDPRSALRPTR